MAATISFTVVLPLLPVSATSGSAKRARQAAARRPSARRVSSTHHLRDGDVGLDRHRDHGRGRAAPDRVGDERVAVEALALQRHEQVAGGDRAAVQW
jgi:hypothetical protein